MAKVESCMPALVLPQIAGLLAEIQMMHAHLTVLPSHIHSSLVLHAGKPPAPSAP